MKSLDIFPTKMFEYRLDPADSFNLLNEVMRKEDTLKIISSIRQTQSTEEYMTDYPNTKEKPGVKLENLEHIFTILENKFGEYNTSFNVTSYWIAVYLKSGFHGLHNHNTTITEHENYSGIIYLTDIGCTTFYSTSPSSFDKMYTSNSEMGKIIIFPSTLPHAVEPTYHEENKRYVIAFNCEMKNK